jgi:hypothetical protein
MKSLRLVPIEYSTDSICYGFTVLETDFQIDLMDAIQRLSDEPVSQIFESFLLIKGNQYQRGVTLFDAHGNSLKSVLCHDLCELSTHKGVLQFQRNRAVWAYLKQLEPESKVVLFWY